MIARCQGSSVGNAERAAIEALLERGTHGPAALVIEGPAGIGKSANSLDAVESARRRGLLVTASRPAETERELANVVLGTLAAASDLGSRNARSVFIS